MATAESASTRRSRLSFWGAEPRTSADLAVLCSGHAFGEVGTIQGLSPVGKARAGDLAFVTDARFDRKSVEAALEGGAVVLMTEESRSRLSPSASGSVGVVGNPRLAFAQFLSAFVRPSPTARVSPTAIVSPSARVHPSAHVGAFCWVGTQAVVGPGVVLQDRVSVGDGVRIGPNSIVRTGAVIGGEGFGFERDENGRPVRLPHVGGVTLGKDVEVGALATVSSGTIDETRVGDGAKIGDNAHVAHNCVLGENVMLAAGVALAGSVRLADAVWLGPNASVKEGVSVGERSIVGIGSVVVRDVPSGEVWAGVPAKKLRDHRGACEGYN